MYDEEILQLLQKVYGLNRYPFDSLLGTELNPVINDQLEEHYSKVEGFGLQEPFIEQWFKTARNLAKPPRILVYGPQGSGRSSVANYIVWQFSKAKKLSSGEIKILLVKVEIKNEDSIEPIQLALMELFKHLRKCLGEQLRTEYKYLYDDYSDLLKNLSSTEYTEEIKYGLAKDIFEQINDILIERKRLTLIILDKVNNYPQIIYANQVFEKAPLLVYTTSGQKIYDSFEQEKSFSEIHGFSVKLSRLSLEDVQQFLDHCWNIGLDIDHKKNHPFDHKGLKVIFEKTTWPFKFIVIFFDQILISHLNQFTINGQQEIKEYEKEIKQEEIVSEFAKYMNNLNI
ncbi:MAG TPA: hypothetical protein DCF68_04775 [Cyanothece sp. UBA12306]|nr:hypothetical protein [Cyanothece sp. UBA12306]